MAALPTVGAPRERSDAAANRRRVLDAARELLSSGGAQAVTMEAVAAAAGVGKGTVYRRFPDAAAIAVALLDERERALQDAVLAGPPPLGPGAAPAQRAAAFGAELLELLETHGEVIALAARDAWFGTPVYAGWHTHLRVLAEQARPEVDAGLLAHELLAPLAPSLVRYLRREQGVPLAMLREAYADLAARLLAESEPRSPSRRRAGRD